MSQDDNLITEGPTPSPHTLLTQRTARYYTLGNPQAAEELWFVLHGYGQLAAYFIRHFQALQNAYVVAPEGLSRFYLSGKYDRIGASWMTREDRLAEIADQASYLTQLFNQVIKLVTRAQIQVNVLGFSQGSATAWRWAVGQQIDFDNLIVWGGAVPVEFAAGNTFDRRRLWVVGGDADEYLTPARVAEQLAGISQASLPAQFLTYQGGHTIPPDALLNLHAALKASQG